MKLPGQTKPASDSLLAAIQEVQEQIGGPIHILDIANHPFPSLRHARAHHDWDNEFERIWLNPNLSYDDQQAVAAHELAHALQKAAGYCQTATHRDKEGNPIIPQLNLLGTVTNSLVTETMAGGWAARRGLKVEEGLTSDALPRALNDAKTKKPGGLEHVDWDTYYSRLRSIARKSEPGEQIIAVTLPLEVNTQTKAVGYANLKLRLSPFGLFSELDSVWAEYWPKARERGIEIAALVDTHILPSIHRLTVRLVELRFMDQDVKSTKEVQGSSAESH